MRPEGPWIRSRCELIHAKALEILKPQRKVLSGSNYEPRHQRTHQP
jgi:hypothetical protein